ncbi:IclR family transcriptional regulator C-terminal domain-containing protein [Timonella senegalensis]|uniref:IclR family transcriptional regulator n=1 Tax=Timonella senegalensis TaxID=1465825 RepID=UPI002FE28903
MIEQATGNERVRLDLALGSAETLHTTSLGKAILAQLPNEKVVEILSQVGMEPHTERSITSVDEFLEHLEIVRRQGYAINDEEDAHGVFGVAAPVFDYTGECLGAITITGLKRQQPSTWYYVDMARQVHEAASGLSRDLGYGRTMTFGGN